MELLIVRQQNDSDWVAADGTPLIREVIINMQIGSPVRIINFTPLIDGQWVKDNTDFNISEPISFGAVNNEIFIDDISKGKKYTIYDLEQTLAKKSNGEFGEQKYSDTFDEAYIIHDELKLKLKIKALEITYVINPPINIPINIDFSRELKGVIEYLSKNTKTAIFTDKIVKGWSE